MDTVKPLDIFNKYKDYKYFEITENIKKSDVKLEIKTLPNFEIDSIVIDHIGNVYIMWPKDPINGIKDTRMADKMFASYGKFFGLFNSEERALSEFYAFKRRSIELEIQEYEDKVSSLKHELSKYKK